jgi:hypothetical protein
VCHECYHSRYRSIRQLHADFLRLQNWPKGESCTTAFKPTNSNTQQQQQLHREIVLENAVETQLFNEFHAFLVILFTKALPPFDTTYV